MAVLHPWLLLSNKVTEVWTLREFYKVVAQPLHLAGSFLGGVGFNKLMHESGLNLRQCWPRATD